MDMLDAAAQPAGDLQKALVVAAERQHTPPGEAQSLLRELESLAETAGLHCAEALVARLREPRAHYLFGEGKTKELIERARALGCGTILFDEELTPAQQRNWEKESGLRVLDRHELILDIFAQRAHTKEATLQVDLARLEYALPRLQRAWTHLDRQRGGGTGLRGVGESQLQIDQRIVRQRVARLKRELAEVVSQRATQRKQRLRTPVPTASIVGYTNAGKSSLLNRLTQAGVLAEDKLFATLDPTTRRLTLPSGQHLLLTDTVGFVRKLPHGLVEAFKATLEEAVVATFLIHVVDAASEEWEMLENTTLAVLDELGARAGKRILTVYNKMDLLPPHRREVLEARRHADSLFASVHTGAGLPELLALLDSWVAGEANPALLRLPHDRWDLVGRLRGAGAVKRLLSAEDAVYVEGHVPARLAAATAPFVITAAELPADFLQTAEIEHLTPSVETAAAVAEAS